MATLFVGLLVYVLRDTARRERKYQEMITQLHQSLSVVREIRKDVTEIKEQMHEKVFRVAKTIHKTNP